MRIDAHVHNGSYSDFSSVGPEVMKDFQRNMKDAGIDGALIISPNPLLLSHWSSDRRMKDLIDFRAGRENLYPFYWINPMEEDALEQVDKAVALGYLGFKMICSNYDVDSSESMAVIEKAAALSKPILFHSGISWDGRKSANRMRPGNFEALLDIPRLKFSLAHVSWPWCDECIAVFGKFLNAYTLRPNITCEMFIDIAPGTPRCYREEVFRHLFGVGYDLKNNIIFGTDNEAGSYNVAWAREWQDLDDSLYAKYYKGDLEDFKERLYGKNVLRFMGIDREKPTHRSPLPAQSN